MDKQDDKNTSSAERASEETSPDMDSLGAAIIVRGEVVAWFKNFDEEAQDWCSYNHFGEWLAWRAKPPEIVPLTKEELERVERDAAALAAKLRVE